MKTLSGLGRDGEGEAPSPSTADGAPSAPDGLGLVERAGESSPHPESGPAPTSVAPTSNECAEREIDELRRFRVRTVPPDMRRRWLLAEVPVVSTLELQDTAPPNRSAMASPPPVSTRESLSAVTRRLPRVVPRHGRSNARFVVISSAAILVAASIAFVLGGAPAPSKTVAAGSRQGTPAVARAAQTARARADKDPDPVTTAKTPPADPPIVTTVGPVHAPLESSSAGAPSPSATARTVARQRHAEDHGGKAPPSAKPATAKSNPDTDIKAPLFGND